MGSKTRLRFAIYTSCQPISKILIRYFALLTFLTAMFLGVYTLFVTYYPSQLGQSSNKPAQPKNNPTLPSKIALDDATCPLATDMAYPLTGYDVLQPEGCSSPVCQLNLERERIKVDIHHSRFQCDTVQSCVTFVVKTRFRFGMVIRLVNSIHRLLPEARVIVADSVGNRKNTSELMQGLTTPSHMRYILVPPKVGNGLKLAIMQVQTPYIFVADDDHMFSKDTDISRLISVLQHSDASLASINHAAENRENYQGVLRVAPTSNPTQPIVQMYYNLFHEAVPCFPSCYVADITKPVFLADKDQILNAGAWDETIVYWGNEDFFFTLRKSALKVVYCDDVTIVHRPPGGALEDRKKRVQAETKKYVHNKWGIAGTVKCGNPDSFRDISQCTYTTPDDVVAAAVQAVRPILAEPPVERSNNEQVSNNEQTIPPF